MTFKESSVGGVQEVSVGDVDQYNQERGSGRRILGAEDCQRFAVKKKVFWLRPVNLVETAGHRMTGH